MPQGSIIGPILFVSYLIPIYKLLENLKIPYNFYAADSQFMFQFDENIDEINIALTLSVEKWQVLSWKLIMIKLMSSSSHQSDRSFAALEK